MNEPIDSLSQIVAEYQLNYVQLHGGESVAYCREVKEKGISIIKVFSVIDQLDMGAIRSFEGIAEYFLFDTKTPGYGGSGRKFDWGILNQYDLKTPYLLSGGIGIEDFQYILKKNFPGLIALDVNSKIEANQGRKNILAIKELKSKIISNNDSYESISKV